MDDCYTSGDCACSKDYVGCMKEACVDEDAMLEFAETCIQKGCTAEQCGLDMFNCNQTGLVCANSYLDCELGAILEDEPTDAGENAVLLKAGEDMGGNVIVEPWCATSFCLRTYFQCMSSAKCTTQADLRAQFNICR